MVTQMGIPSSGRLVRAIGFDDSPFSPRNAKVGVAGVVCAGTRFEGMVWGKVKRDGWNATAVLCRLLLGKKFLPQLHLVLLDGIALGGLNIVDLLELSIRTGKPCIAVMRRRPNLEAMARVIRSLPHAERRLNLLRRAGPIYEHFPFMFQCAGIESLRAKEALARLTDTGYVPEALRLAHLIGAAVRTGESGRRA